MRSFGLTGVSPKVLSSRGEAKLVFSIIRILFFAVCIKQIAYDLLAFSPSMLLMQKDFCWMNDAKRENTILVKAAASQLELQGRRSLAAVALGHCLYWPGLYAGR
jgi:hypothetical protein